MKKIIVVLIVALAAAGIFLYLKKNNYEIFGASLKLTKNKATQKIFKIGVVLTGGAYQQALDGLKEGLREKGYADGENVVFLIKDTRGNTDAIKPETEKLLAENPDVVYSVSTPVTTQVAKIAGERLPIVFNIVGDPVGAGFVKSYSEPGSNLTGCSNLSAELSGKRMEIFREAFPNLKKLVTFYDPSNKFSQISTEHAKKAAEVLGLELAEILVRDKTELTDRLNGIPEGAYDGIYITPDAMVISSADIVIKRAVELKIPSMGHEETLAEKGVSLAYGANFFRLGKQCASVLAEIFAGQPPQNIPVRTPNKLDITVNAKSLEAIGAAISPKTINLADRVIH